MSASKLTFLYCAILAAVLVGATANREAPRAEARRPLGRVAHAARSVWDSVYTAEQAKRGEAIYVARCARCHAEKLTGQNDSPTLVGPMFLANWNNFTVFDLNDKIYTMMPSDSVGVLSRELVTDVMTYLFSFNGFPAGRAEMQSSPEYMKDIKIEASKPARPSR